jgi:hypothetical protein
MTTTEHPESPIAAPPSDDETANLRVSIIYDDFPSGVRAKQCLDRLAGSLNLEKDAFAVRLWSHELLSEPAVRRAAAREAGAYDIVFLSMRDSAEPSLVLKDWLKEWLEHRGSQPCALAVLPGDERQDASNPLLSYLAGVADEAGGIDLVYTPATTPQEPEKPADYREIARRAINASPILDGILDDWESHSHWGINE